MAITSFDTHKYVRRLQEAGVSLEQAEVQTELLTEAFAVNLEELVTKDYLSARFAEQNASIDARFAEFRAEVLGRFKLLEWMLGITMAAVVIPLVQQILI